MTDSIRIDFTPQDLTRMVQRRLDQIKVPEVAPDPFAGIRDAIAKRKTALLPGSPSPPLASWADWAD